ncbi:MAG: hypothetical protein Q9176_003749 [Flavoplaca citrina]
MPSNTRLKLVVRRLPPGLTQEEFETSLGAEWRVGSGKVDWAAYKPGKVSKDPSKPSRPSRAYLNLTKQEYIGSLSETVRAINFIDARASSKDPVLLGPPSVEYAPFPRTPHSKVRRDNRQGTIDQDPEFIEFLESLTDPLPKAPTVDQRVGSEEKSKEKITTTPLIQFLRDKKANKGKDTAAATTNPKATKHAKQPTKEPQPTTNASDKKPTTKTVTAQSPDKRSAQAIMVEKAARDAARVLNKQSTTPNKPQAPTAAPTPPALSPATAATSPLAEKRRERGSASAAASILRRDLGIGSSPGTRGGRRGVAASQSKPSSTDSAQPPPTATAQQKDAKGTDNTTTDQPSDVGSTDSSSVQPVASTQAPSTSQPPTGPAASRVSTKGTTTQSTTPTTNVPSKQIPITPTATQAFLKHANPSQGITEPLLSEAFAAFGTVKSVEIDRKKGSAYVDFEEPEGLQKAIKASPIKVAQGQVVVLERRMGPNVQGRNIRGGPAMSNRGIPDARGGMSSHRGRAAMPHNRGVPMGPVGGRGNGIRGRGGFVRGGGNVQNVKPATTTTTTTTTMPKTTQVDE